MDQLNQNMFCPFSLAFIHFVIIRRLISKNTERTLTPTILTLKHSPPVGLRGESIMLIASSLTQGSCNRNPRIREQALSVLMCATHTATQKLEKVVRSLKWKQCIYPYFGTSLTAGTVVGTLES